MNSWISLFAVASLLGGCAFDHKKDDGAGKSDQAVLAGAPVSYAQVSATVLGPRCVGCHSVAGGNQGGINLEGYDATFPLVNRILQAAVNGASMPKGGSLSEGEKKLLGAWIAQGAPKEATASSGAHSEAPPGWAAVRDEIFEKKCTECHSPPNPEKGLDLSTLDSVRTHIGVVFNRVVVTDAAQLAPYEQMGIQEKQDLARWIALGMPE